MRFTKNQIFIVILVVALSLGAWLYSRGQNGNTDSSSVSKKSENATSTFLASDESFTFDLPNDFEKSLLDQTDKDGSVHSLMIFTGDKKERNFQIYTSSYDDVSDLTIEKIKKDLPNILVINPEEISVDGARGVAFESNTGTNGLTTREIWFSHSGTLYQVSTVKDFDEQMVNILSSWKWR